MPLKYTIAFEADKHWGAMKMEDQYRSSYILKRFLAEYPIDLFISLGDFFDTKHLLNSKSSIYAIRDFQDKLEICKARGIPVRAIRGTMSHDYDQWKIFTHFMDDPSYHFRYFDLCTVEETLPGMRIWYAPEENMSFADYMETYGGLLIGDHPIHLAAMHGNFDRIMPDIAVKANEMNSDTTTLIFHYDDLAPLVRGPMVAGHWHNGDTFEHLSYVGSYDRWTFAEEDPKGFAIYEYDTETNEYRHILVPNFLALDYKTYEIRTSLIRTPEEYAAVVEAVEASLAEDVTRHVRILCKLDEMLPDTEQQIDSVKYHFVNDRRVHFTLINQIRQEKKRQEKQKKKRLDNTFGFIHDKNMDLSEKIQKYILVTTGKEYRVADIRGIVERYAIS